MPLAVIEAHRLHPSEPLQRPRQAGGAVLPAGEQHQGAGVAGSVESLADREVGHDGGVLYTIRARGATITGAAMPVGQGGQTMMLLLALLALAAEPPTAGPPPAGSSAAEAPGDDTASSLAGLQKMYDQGCAAREYGAYDDLCDQLTQQLKQARAEAAREARRKAVEARHRPPATRGRPQAPSPVQPAPPTPAPLPGAAPPE